LWFFKTQEEIKTSHEYPVQFALYNTEFEAVVSGDDGSFIAVWDIETGKLMSKFGDAHNKAKITAGCFDSTQRRLITTGSDGTARMWNFSNGQCLTELLSDDSGKHVESEITGVACAFEDSESEKMAHVIAVGWDRKIHIWADEKEEEVVCNKVLPRNEQRGHGDDIMCVAYNKENQLIYTGGHDGSLIAWNFETGYIKFYLHELDPTCMSKSGNHILESKSVDCILILYKHSLICSVSADQMIRFWDFDPTNTR
jgi:WD40 repeat protein